MAIHHRLRLILTFAVLTFSFGQIVADDTEIYLGSAPTDAAGVPPNVLFVLDTSSSMNNEDGTGVTRLQRMKDALHQILDSANNINVGLMRFHREGGPVLYPLAYIDESASVVEGSTNAPLVRAQIAQSSDDAEERNSDGSVTLTSDRLEMTADPQSLGGTQVVQVQVISENDTAEERISDGDMYLNSSDLELIDDSSFRGLQVVGIRFQNIDIPAGATILSADIEFEIDEKKTEATSLVIEGQKAVSPFEFADVAQNISDRPRTNASIAWNDLPILEVNDKLTTPDITSIVQEIIDQPTWTDGGNPMVFIITGSGKRTVESYHAEPDNAPLLRITYETSGVQETQLTGLRFTDVKVPQGATITSAQIEFEAARGDSGATALTIDGEAADDAATFTTATNDISGRTRTGSMAQVAWNTIPAWTQGERYLTPDLTGIVQEIVDRTGWCGGNAMSFILEGTGLRIAQAYDGNTAAVPVLHIDYDEATVADNACINQVVRVQVVSGTDDAEENDAGGMYLNSSDLELVHDGANGDQTVGIRFRDIPILQNSTILEAHLEFTVDETDTVGTSLVIRGELSGDSAAFGSATNDISGRSTTTASVSWAPPAWSTVGDKHQSPDISAIVQEIVNQIGWNPGNAMGMIITGSGERTAESYDGDPAAAPVLIIKVQGKLGSSIGFKTVRDRLHDIVDEINYKTGTPIVDTLYEAALYYRGDDVFYGATRGNSADASTSLDRSEYSRVSHPASYTGGTVVREAGCTDANLNDVACKTEQIANNPTYISPITASCQSNHIILLSDGFPSVNTAVNRVETMTGTTCAGSGSGKCGVELLTYLNGTDQTDAFSEAQTISTYTIGFNILPDGKAYLQALATAGDGQFFEAASSTDLVNAFQAIITEILQHPTSFAAPSLTVNAFNKLFHNNEVYFSLFEPDSRQRWNGNVKKYKVCEGNAGDTCSLGEIIDANDVPAIGSDVRIKDTAQSLWGTSADGAEIQLGGAGAKIPSYSTRKLFTYTGSTAPSNITLDSADHRVLDSNTALTKTLLGSTTMSDAERTELIEWMRGKDVKDEDDDSTTNENRWIFQDPLHSGSVPITYGKDSSDPPVPVVKLFVATNDGAVRMINAVTGVEEWAFIPQVMLEKQQDLMNNIQGDHIYGLDKTPEFRIHDADGNGIIEPGNGDFVHMYVGMRRGGRNIYAFDVTPAATLTNPSTTGGISPKLLWRIQGGSGDFAKLGETWSAPRLANILYDNSGTLEFREVLIFGGGYEAGSQDRQPDDSIGFGPAAYGNAIYIVDAATGARLWWASSDTTANLVLADMQYAIPSDLAIFDANGSGHDNRIYVGDTGGQLWRIDLWSDGVDGNGDPVINAPAAARLAAISDDTTDAGKRKFFYPPDVAQLNDKVFSGDPLYDLITIASGDRANPLETAVHDRIYAFRDYQPLTAIAGECANPGDANCLTPSTNSDLFDATSNLIQQGTADQKEAAVTELKTSKGWFIELKEFTGDNPWIGEKGLASPLILAGKLFFTTYVPGASSGDVCASAVEGGGRLYAVNLLSAAALFDWDSSVSQGKDNLTKEDRRYGLGSGIPSEAIPLFQKNGVTLIVGSGGGATTIDPGVGLPRNKSFWLQENIH